MPSLETQFKKGNSLGFQKGHSGMEGRKHSDETKRKIGRSTSIALKGKKIPEEVRKKMSEAKKGEKSYLWKGGISPENHKIRGSLKYRLWREAVFKRDGYKCVSCEIKTNKGLGETVILNAHHIKPFAYFPELRFELTNGQTLCIECHKKTDTYLKSNHRKLSHK